MTWSLWMWSPCAGKNGTCKRKAWHDEHDTSVHYCWQHGRTAE